MTLLKFGNCRSILTYCWEHVPILKGLKTFKFLLFFSLSQFHFVYQSLFLMFKGFWNEYHFTPLIFWSQKSKTPVVTTAEVSSEESTKAESPEQPQAVTMMNQPKASLSTVHVQQSFHGIRQSIPVLTHSASEVKKKG